MKNSKESTRDLIGLKEVREHSFITTAGAEVVFFVMKPSNLSVMSEDGLRARIYSLVTVLKGVSEIDMMCLNSKESYDDNKRFLRKRLKEERNPVVRKLLEADLQHLDLMQVQMATAREFLLLVRPKEKNEREKENTLIRIEKLLEEQGFKVRRAGMSDIKRILAVYFEQNVTTEEFEDTDGERWVIFGENE
ncbi:MAG: hypothetical protein IKN45_07505 [Lachnospiraceae bacterium]|nr:hypothetical protein [Lachnospiraceae bacterium]